MVTDAVVLASVDYVLAFAFAIWLLLVLAVLDILTVGADDEETEAADGDSARSTLIRLK